MIDIVLLFIERYLNKELKMTLRLDENADVVILNSLTNPDGSIAEKIENKIVLTVLNLEQETTVKMNRQYVQDQNSFGKVAPPVYLNVYLLVSANYSNYKEGLKRLSGVIQIFQSNTYFNGKQHADFPPEFEKFTIEIVNVPISELSQIWSGIGAKYLPSLIYKIRTITIVGSVVKSEASGITGLTNGTTR